MFIWVFFSLMDVLNTFVTYSLFLSLVLLCTRFVAVASIYTRAFRLIFHIYPNFFPFIVLSIHRANKPAVSVSDLEMPSISFHQKRIHKLSIQPSEAMNIYLSWKIPFYFNKFDVVKKKKDEILLSIGSSCIQLLHYNR